MNTLDELITATDTIHRQAQAALVHLDAIERALATLEQQGVFPAVPVITWKDRAHKYMELRFPAGTPGHDTGNQRQYIGADPGAQAHARAQIERSQRHETLRTHRDELRRWLRRRGAEVQRLAEAYATWPRAGL